MEIVLRTIPPSPPFPCLGSKIKVLPFEIISRVVFKSSYGLANPGFYDNNSTHILRMSSVGLDKSCRRVNRP